MNRDRDALTELVKASNDYRLAIDAADGTSMDAYGRLAVAEERGRQALSPTTPQGEES